MLQTESYWIMDIKAFHNQISMIMASTVVHNPLVRSTEAHIENTQDIYT